MLPHRIALRGPWTAIASSGESRTVRLPHQWVDAVRLGDGPLRLIRKFGWPSQLAPHERLWLLVGNDHEGSLALNGRFFPLMSGEMSMLLAEPLLERNELVIEFERTPAGMPLCLEVSLEVRGQAWLDELVADRVGDSLKIRGRLRGQAEGLLDLYAILNRRTVIQTSLRADNTVQKIALTSPSLDDEMWNGEVHVELMSGGTIYHAAEVPIRGS